VNCQEVQEELAVAVLTRQPADPAAVAHLAGCPTCAAEAEHLAPVVRLLAVAEPPSAMASSNPTPAALHRLLDEAARRRRRRTGRWVVSVAAALVLAVPIGIVVAHRVSAPDPVVAARTSIERTATDPVTGVSAQVRLWQEKSGSGLTVAISGVKPGTRCTVDVVQRDGSRQAAATWWATYGGTASVAGSVAAPVSDIARLEIVDGTGKVLVPIPLG
jgi:hypothetical protein